MNSAYMRSFPLARKGRVGFRQPGVHGEKRSGCARINEGQRRHFRGRRQAGVLGYAGRQEEEREMGREARIGTNKPRNNSGRSGGWRDHARSWRVTISRKE